MLVLSRKTDEALVINGIIEVKIIEISGDKVKLGIDAPRDCKILRKELLKTMDANKEAANSKIVSKDKFKQLLLGADKE